MRSSGEVRSSHGLRPHDHLCWIFDDRAEFGEAASTFLAEGLQLGERVAYIGNRSFAELASELAGMGDIERLLADGSLDITSIEHTYGDHDAAQQVQVYEDATGDALGAGFTGLRVAAEATSLVVDTATRELFVQYEHLVDRMMARGVPFAAMCGYDRNVLGADVEELAHVHPLTHGATASFRVHSLDGSTVALTGEVDAMSAAALALAIRRVLVTRAHDDVAVDCSALAFIDHRCLLTLESAARDAAVRLHLFGTRQVVRRIAAHLPLDAVVVTPAY